MISRIKQVLGTPCNTPSAPEFRFEFLEEAAKHNSEVLRKYNYDLSRALEAQKDSLLDPGKEFKPLDVLWQVFGLHPLWSRIEAILTHGSKWLLVEISKEEQVQGLKDALTFGNHKGALAKPELLKKPTEKDVKHGYSVPIPLNSVKQILGLEMAPMNIMDQNTINELGQVIPKDRLTLNQSWRWSSGTSVNSRVQKEQLQECRYGFCIQRLVNWAVAAQKKYPNKRIMATKNDCKSACGWDIFAFYDCAQNGISTARWPNCDHDLGRMANLRLVDKRGKSLSSWSYKC
jgi:hypothetical protein